MSQIDVDAYENAWMGLTKEDLKDAKRPLSNLTDEEKKRLHAVSSINYDKVVASGGVDLGIIKNKKKNKDETPLNRHKAGHKISKWRQMENEKFEAEKAAHKAEKARLLEITRKRREKTYGTDQSSWGK